MHDVFVNHYIFTYWPNMHVLIRQNSYMYIPVGPIHVSDQIMVSSSCYLLYSLYELAYYYNDDSKLRFIGRVGERSFADGFRETRRGDSKPKDADVVADVTKTKLSGLTRIASEQLITN